MKTVYFLSFIFLSLNVINLPVIFIDHHLALPPLLPPSIRTGLEIISFVAVEICLVNDITLLFLDNITVSLVISVDGVRADV